MAHLDKYTRQELRRILRETYREYDDPTKYENDVDPARTKNNYNFNHDIHGSYGKMKKHKALLAEGKPLPPWKDVKIRCHDFRVTFCTICYEAGVKIKTLQSWMGHKDAAMIMDVYAKLTGERELKDGSNLDKFTQSRFAS